MSKLGFTSAVGKEKSPLVVLFGSAMIDQALDNKIDCLEDVTARFIIAKFNIAELDNFTYKIEFRLGNGMEKGTVSVI